MSILSGYKKFKKYIKTSSGFQLQSLWTSANTVEADDKRTIQTKVGAINGISSSETANSAEIAASTALTNKMNGTINNLSRDLNQRFPDGTGLQWDGTNFWGTTADGMKVKLGSLTYRDFTVTPTANSGSMSIDISDIPNYKDLILWETLFPRMLSDLDMANWNTSMLRTGVGYDWNYDADKGILSISSRHTECVLIQYGTGLKQRTVRVHYI